MTTRRSFLKFMAAGALMPMLGCRTGRTPRRAASGGRPQPKIDLSFAEAVLAGAPADELAGHPAALALARHQTMSGNPAADPREIVEEILEQSRDRTRTCAVLETWSGQAAALAAAMASASAYLPPDSLAPQHLYAVTGYDIGVAAPPDVVLNAGHERFLNDPGEGIFYACHEAHHVGFLHHRTLPDMTALGGPGILGEVVDFITQMEGMAVHAAWPLREKAGALEADPDYEVYLSAEKAAEAEDAWRALRALCGTARFDEANTISEVLNGMTSGGRLAYRYGAVVCAHMEAQRGREALAASVVAPETFNL
jgi:hypothetical protein